MPTDYTLSELAKLAGVTPRTVRYYIAQGLLSAPAQLGPNTRYTDAHLDRLRLIRRLQAAHLPLAEIRKQLAQVPGDRVADFTENRPPTDAPSDSALDYIQSLLAPTQPMVARSIAPPAPAVAVRETAPVPPPPAATERVPEKPTEPDRAQWERITLDPDVELHIRRPLTRQQNRRIERLISIARQLLEEE